MEKTVISKGVFSLKESLDSLTSLESLGNCHGLLVLPQFEGSLASLKSLDSLDNGPFLKRPLFPKAPFSNPESP